MEYRPDLISILKQGKYAVIPTDTLYGIVCDARNEEAVEVLYQVRKRDPSKPFIVLIADKAQLELFGISPQRFQKTLDRYWPGPVSIVLPCSDQKYAYLHRGTGAIAFRLPADEPLRKFLGATGPLVAPSANIEGMPPATTVQEAKHFFGDAVAYYLDGGEVRGAPSTIIKVKEDGSIEMLR